MLRDYRAIALQGETGRGGSRAQCRRDWFEFVGPDHCADLESGRLSCFGIDLNGQRVALASEMGADLTCTNDSAVVNAQAFTSGHGFDAVLITADTASNGPVELAGEIARNRGVIVAVGAVGMNIPRKIFYEKELDFRLSRSYGPGRYDPEYEEKGHDYPYEYVRWTEQRNIEAFVELLTQKR